MLVENFRTGTMESFGLGYDVLAEINPRLIYCSVSAFGRTGPRKDSPGYEALMQAFSGIMSITGEPGGQPVRSAVSFLDLTTGILCTLGVSAAVLQREKTGLGQRVDGSLLETAVSLLAYHAEGYLLAGVVPQPLGSGHPSLSPYRNFKCGDGQWIFIAAANDRFWQKLARALGLEGMATDPRFAGTWSASRTARSSRPPSRRSSPATSASRCCKLLDAADVPATPVNTVDQVMNDAQTLERGIIQRAQHPASRRDSGHRHAAQVLAHDARACGARRRCGASTPTRSSPSAATRRRGSSELRDKKVIL